LRTYAAFAACLTTRARGTEKTAILGNYTQDGNQH